MINVAALTVTSTHVLGDDDKNDTNIETTLRLLTIFVTRLYLYIRTRLTCTRARLLLLVDRLNVCEPSVLIAHACV